MWDEITYPLWNFKSATLKFRMDKKFHLTLYWTCGYLSMLRLKLNQVGNRCPRRNKSTVSQELTTKLPSWYSIASDVHINMPQIITSNSFGKQFVVCVYKTTKCTHFLQLSWWAHLDRFLFYSRNSYQNNHVAFQLFARWPKITAYSEILAFAESSLPMEYCIR